VTFYFSFQSPYAALASFRIDDLLAGMGVELDPVPVVPPPSDPPTGLAAQILEFKRSYMLEDAARWANKLNIPWRVPAQREVDVTDASAGYMFARTKGLERDFRNAVFRARWCEGKNIGDHDVLVECAEDCRLSPTEFLQVLRSKTHHHQVEEALLRCLEDEVFGVPLFVANGKRFWGNDRIDFLLEELNA
jgi:2-hydroxychromene-2-carboxylate isomerase